MTAGGAPQPVDGGFGYPLPQPGYGVALGTATAEGVRPASFTAAEWQYSLFDSYGGGVFVSDYSAGGAYVIAGTGGHNHPDFTGAVAFDFTTGQWARLDDATGTPARSMPYRLNETNGGPEYEISIGSTPPNTVPAPPHPYMNLMPLPTSLGGGPRGSVVYPVKAAQCVESVTGMRAHRFDLDTRRWSRFTSNRLPEVVTANDVGPESPSVFDVVGRRYWQLPTQIHNVQRIGFIDLTEPSPRWQASVSWPYPSTWEGTPTAFIDEQRRLIVIPAGTRLIALDLNNLAAGPRLLPFTGTSPGLGNRWELYPPDGSYYSKGQTSNFVYRLTPPTGDPFTQMWRYSQFSVQGVALPQTSPVGVRHYTRFFYVPALGVFAWIATATSPVFLIRPP